MRRSLPSVSSLATSMALALASALAPAALQAQRPARGAAPVVALRAGMTITRSLRVRPGTYRLAPAPGDTLTPILRIRGTDVVVDFGGAVLEGAPAGTSPDRYAGVAVEIDSGARVTLRGARIRGYKIAVLARGTRGLRLAGNDLSDNWRPRLYSGLLQESLVDWLSYHHNERNEWLRYGAAIYLDGVRGGEIRDNVAERGMNGLMLARSSGLRVWNNTFSHLSGLGIGLYRSTADTIMHNRVDWCVRGYSHGFYNRGQDSAALLLFEQSSDNVVAYNSMTHGGDGLFLWAGQETMDAGTGGSNDNLFYGNDFSFAPTNAMEATFSRNRFVNNRAAGSWHGLWGGYSYDSPIVGNHFGGDVVGIAIEHGQANRIVGNRFDGDTTAIQLWWNAIEPGDWGYPKHHDTRSRDYTLEDNVFAGNRVALRIDSTQGVRGHGNRLIDVDTAMVVSGDTTGWTGGLASVAPTSARAAALPAWTPRGTDPAVTRLAPRPLPGARDPFTAAARRDRAAIVVDAWGPYDGRAPKLWPVLDSANARVVEGWVPAAPYRLRVLGPAGRWRVVRAAGATVRPASGRVGDTLVVTPAADTTRVADERLELELVGTAHPVRFAWRRVDAHPRWRVRVFAWDSTSDPRPDTTGATRADGAAALRRITAAAPVLATEAPRLDWTWYRPKVAGVPQERFVAVAESRVTLPAGRWRLRTISDDGVRAWVDGRLAIDHWAPHESAVDETPLAPGAHELRVEYYQVDGWTELRAEVVPDGM